MVIIPIHQCRSEESGDALIEHIFSKYVLPFIYTFCLSIYVLWLDEYLSWVLKYQSTQVLSLNLIIKLK